MARLLIVTALPLLALMERLKADGHDIPEGTELVTVDPKDPEWRSKVDAALAEGSVGSFRGISTDIPAPDQFTEPEPDDRSNRKLAAQFSPMQVMLPIHLRKRRL